MTKKSLRTWVLRVILLLVGLTLIMRTWTYRYAERAFERIE